MIRVGLRPTGGRGATRCYAGVCKDSSRCDPAAMPAHPVTPDGRYFVVRGRLWRCSNPQLTGANRQALVDELMSARRAVRAALSTSDSDRLSVARSRVNLAKRDLGERGPVWWSDGSPDLNRRMVARTPYAEWFAKLGSRE